MAHRTYDIIVTLIAIILILMQWYRHATRSYRIKEMTTSLWLHAFAELQDCRVVRRTIELSTTQVCDALDDRFRESLTNRL